MINAAIAAGSLGLILVLSEVILRKAKISGELARKAVHIVTGVFVAFLPFWVGYKWIFWIGLIVVAGSIFNRYARIFKSVHGVKRISWGELLSGVAIMAGALIAPSEWFFMAGFLQVALADGFAAIVGVTIFKLRGKYKIMGSTKTYAGSMAFFIVSAIIIAATLAFDPVFASPMSQWPLVLMLAALLTATENAGLYGSDNLLLPLATIFVLGLF